MTIEEPDKFYYPSGLSQWLRRADNGDENLLDKYMWNDLKRTVYSPAQWDKTLFDPCPPGWRLPGSILWKDEFTDRDGRTNSDDKGREQLKSIIDGWYGIRYWPYKLVGTTYPVDGTIFYPIWASLANGQGSSFYQLVVRSVEPNTLFFSPSSPYPYISSAMKSEAGVVRCIQE